MNRWLRTAAAVLTALALMTAPQVVAADNKAEIERLDKSRDSERYTTAVPGQSIHAGGGRIMVNAPLSVVRGIVTDFGHYQDFMPRFKRSRVIAKNKRFTDVYLQVPILHGTATVWAVTRFLPPEVRPDGTEVIRGLKEGDGNVREFQATWSLIPVGPNKTLLRAELLIVPKLPLPGSVVTPELAYAADKAVSATRDRAEARVAAMAAGSPTTP